MGYHRPKDQAPKIDLGDYQPARDKSGHYLPGRVSNPVGRPADKRSISLITVLKRRFREKPELADEITQQLLKLARRKGVYQMQAIKEILDRIDGKPVDNHNVKMENPVSIRFVPAPSKPVEPVDTNKETVPTL